MDREQTRDRASEIEMMGSQYFQCLTKSHSGWSFNHGDKVLWACNFFFFFLKHWSEPWEPFTVLKSGRFNRGSNCFVLFLHRTILVVKGTVLVRGSRLSRSDRTFRSGSENHGNLRGLSNWGFFFFSSFGKWIKSRLWVLFN